MMLVCTDVRSCEHDDLVFRKRALRNAVICIGWIKLSSIICYVLLYCLVHAYSKGEVSEVIQIMTLVAIVPQVLLGVLLFLGALEEKPLALELALWLCLIVASYNTVLGLLGAIFFIRTGHVTMHFLLVVIFGLLALSLCTIICHDFLIIYAYKKLLRTYPALCT